MILTGLSGIVIVEIYAAVMQLKFQNTTNNVGKGFAILGIYLFVTIYCEPTIVLINMHWLPRLILHRRYAEQYNVAIWSGNRSHPTTKQSYGPSSSIPFYRQRWS
jgi:uncharacterized membrane protein